MRGVVFTLSSMCYVKQPQAAPRQSHSRRGSELYQRFLSVYHVIAATRTQISASNWHSVLALQCCRRDLFLFNLWRRQSDPYYVYTEADLASSVPDAAWTEVIAQSPPNSAAANRAEVLSFEAASPRTSVGRRPLQLSPVEAEKTFICPQLPCRPTCGLAFAPAASICRKLLPLSSCLLLPHGGIAGPD